MKNLIKNYLLFSLLLLAGISFNACLEEDFDQPPTGGIDPGLTATTTIAELKAMHAWGEKETIAEDLIIKGIVAADDASGNYYQIFVLQDETAGINVLVEQGDAYVNYPVGREIYIKCKGLVLSDYNNLISLGGGLDATGSPTNIIDLTGHIIKGVKKEPYAPKVKKIAELTLDDVSTLITLENVQFITDDTASTYADQINKVTLNKTMEDCGFNPILVRTSGFASFAGEKIPSGSGTFTGILSVFRNDFQFIIRDLSDIHLDNARCVFDPCAGTVVTTVTSIDEDFESGANNQDLALTGWTNIAVKGSRLWRYKEFDGNVYVQATAFNDTAPEMESWIVTPGIQLDAPKVASFQSAQAFFTHNAMSVWISSDFVCDPANASWQPLNCTLAGTGEANYEFISSGDIDLSGFSGKVFIGFKYVGDGGAGQTVSYQIDNLVVKNK